MILPQARPRSHGGVVGVAVVVTALATATWFVEPTRYATCLVAIATMGCLWIVVAASRGTPWDATQTDSQRRFVTFAAVIAGWMLAASLAIKLAAATGGVGVVHAERLAGIAAGILLTVFADRLPKIVSGAAADRRSAARSLAVHRFVGWSFVMLGVATIALWSFADIDRAADWSQRACAAAVLLVVVRGARNACAPAARPDRS